jgi:hypothetical protein
MNAIILYCLVMAGRQCASAEMPAEKFVKNAEDVYAKLKQNPIQKPGPGTLQ